MLRTPTRAREPLIALLDRYIAAMEVNTGRLPTSLTVPKKEWPKIEHDVKQGRKPWKVRPSDNVVTYRGIPLRVA